MKIEIRPFSIRHKKAILGKKIDVSLSIRLRKRIWKIIEDYNYVCYFTTEYGYNESEKLTDVVEKKLLKLYGEDELTVRDKISKNLMKVDLKEFTVEAYPSQILDLMEVFYDSYDDFEPSRDKSDFQYEINITCQEEESPWQMVDGQFLKVDSDFLNLQIASKANELLKAEGFEGALDEFAESLNELISGSTKKTIHSIEKSFESVMKTILGVKNGNASELIKKLQKKGFFEDIPKEARDGFAKQVLMVLPFMRNKLGGHGQGEEKIKIPKEYANLAIHLGGSLIYFLVNKHRLKSRNEEEIKEEIEIVENDEELPF